MYLAASAIGSDSFGRMVMMYSMNMQVRSALAITVGLLTLSGAWSAFAVPSAMSHEMLGTVQRVDHNTITILTSGASKPTVFAWDSKDTRFFQNDRPATIDSVSDRQLGADPLQPPHPRHKAAALPRFMASGP
jgi:hypothetical protein